MWSVANLLELDRATTRLCVEWWEVWKWEWWRKPVAKQVKGGDTPGKTDSVVKQVERGDITGKADPVGPVELPCKSTSSFPELTAVAEDDEFAYRFHISNHRAGTDIHVSNVTVGALPVRADSWNYIVLRFKGVDNPPVMVLVLDMLYACRFRGTDALCEKRSGSQPQNGWGACSNLLQKRFWGGKTTSPFREFKLGEGWNLSEFELNGVLCCIQLVFYQDGVLNTLKLNFSLDRA